MRRDVILRNAKKKEMTHNECGVESINKITQEEN